MTHYDELETLSAEARAADHLAALNLNLERTGQAPLEDLSGLAALPVLRKADLASRQAGDPPFGGVPVANVSHLFQSPGPIYEPGGATADWWRVGRFLHACGIGAGDVVHNCFGYHLTPAGHIFESGARAVGAAVIPAGTGQTDLQVRAAADCGATAYAGTPDYLKVILDRAEEQGVTLRIAKAAVGGGALFPSMREGYAARGVTVLQNYATADLGNIAYEVPNPDGGAPEGMIVDEGVIVEIVRPGTGDPVPEGEVGEVVVTALGPDYPLIRFATGDLSAVLPGASACGRTNMRIRGWMGRADQTTKIKGMFVRPEQVAALVAAAPGVTRARVIAERDGANDAMRVVIEGGDPATVEALLPEHLKLRGRVEAAGPEGLPNDGVVIEDARDYDA